MIKKNNLQEPIIGGELAEHKAYCNQSKHNKRCEACGSHYFASENEYHRRGKAFIPEWMSKIMRQ